MKLKTLILDDEKFSRDILEILITEHCPEIEIVAKCSSAADAIMQKMYNEEFSMKIIRVENNDPLLSGTKVTLRIPLNLV